MPECGRPLPHVALATFCERVIQMFIALFEQVGRRDKPLARLVANELVDAA